MVRPDGIEDGVITLFVVRRSEFLASEEMFAVVAGWLAEGVLTACVVGFPSGAHHSEVKVAEAAQARANGADEVDMRGSTPAGTGDPLDIDRVELSTQILAAVRDDYELDTADGTVRVRIVKRRGDR